MSTVVDDTAAGRDGDDDDDDDDLEGEPFYDHALHALSAAALRTPPEALADRVCAVAVDLMDLDGASLTTQYTPTMAVPVGASDPMAAAAEQAQFTSGQGPCLHALRTAALGLITDLHDPQDTGRLRWPTYALLLARASDYRCVLAVPVPPPPHPWPGVREPSTDLGLPVALTVYRRHPLMRASSTVAEASTAVGALLRRTHSVSAAMSVVLSQMPPAEGRARSWLDARTAQARTWVWRAEEVLQRADRSLSREEALAALRTYSIFEGLTIDEAAEMLVAGRLTVSAVRGRT
ncbi:hypothetical protein FHN55_21070 [Streptomyces sp. NP160]|uniref:hypothetical protein n=1 Tax=Streptomyces sp. NP160 TaxID=2586637 RepID=UPI00111ABC0F|nr:hypothetical protein [Streptomyces sp. NP160]TNM59390.1 hypothetical protein FHN55_21070 [Streptomyces sp. NP160]